MGLDMYLRKKTYIGNNYKDKENQVRLNVPGIKQERVTEIIEQVAYWRKANQIHRWFVVNVQDGNDHCKEHFVSRADLEQLLELCQRVKKASTLVKGQVENGYQMGENGEIMPNLEKGYVIEDPSLAEELLPAQEGFFFGSTDYDQYYLKDIDLTIDQLTEVLSEPDTGDLYYQSSW